MHTCKYTPQKYIQMYTEHNFPRNEETRGRRYEGVRGDTGGKEGYEGVQDCVGERFCIDPFPITEDLKPTDIILESDLLDNITSQGRCSNVRLPKSE